MSTVAQTPNTLNPINRGGKWIINQVPTSPPVETRLAWQVEVDGSLVSEGNSLTTSGTDNVPVDPRDDIIGFMKHTIPGVGAQNVYNVEDELTCDVTLKHGTVVIDTTSEPPPDPVVSILGSSGPFKFINASIFPTMGDVLNGGIGAVWLSAMPDEVYTTPFSYGFIYLYGTSGINGAWRKCDGTTGVFTMSAPHVANAIPCGIKNLGLDEDVEFYSLTFVATGRTINFSVACGFTEDQCGNILFVEPYGGLSAHAFTDVNVGGSYSSITTEFHAEPDAAYATWAQYGGMSTLKRVGYPSYAMSIRVRISEGYRNWVNGMQGSPIAWVQLKDVSGNDIFVKAFITGASLTAAGIDGFGFLSVQATLALGLEGQRSVY